jgi:inorganic pyrophosphatase
MPAITSLQKAEKFEIEKYKAPKDIRALSKTHVPYTGSPLKHPLDQDRIILVPDPYIDNSPYLEFNKPDISFVEKLANIVNLEGETVAMVRIWVEKGSVAIQCTPFQVTSGRRSRG